MVETTTKLPVRSDKAPSERPSGRRSNHFEAPLQSLRHEMDRLFDYMTGRSTLPMTRRPLFDLDDAFSPEMIYSTGIPAADVVERDGEYEIVAELPGLSENDIEVRVSNDILSITGEKRDRREERGKDYHLTERRFGSFARSFSLPRSVDRERIEASLSKGVLTLRLPKTPEAMSEAKRISVKAA